MKKCTKCNRYEKDDQMLFCVACGTRLIDCAPNESLPSVSDIKFCMNCGTEFNEYGVCPKCGNTKTKQLAIGAKGESYFTKIKDCVFALISSSPFNGIENAGRETAHSIWPICASVFVLLNSLGIAKWLVSDIKGLGNSLLGEYYSYVDSYINPSSIFGKLFLLMFISSLILLFGSTALLQIPLKSSEDNISYTQLLNLNSFALLPISAASVITFLSCLISPVFGFYMGILSLMTGLFASVISAYYGLQKIARFNKSPFWSFIGILAADVIVMLVSIYLAGSIIK